jgi:hypothetical protein
MLNAHRSPAPLGKSLEKNHYESPQQERKQKGDTDPENCCNKLFPTLLLISVRSGFCDTPRNVLVTDSLHFVLAAIWN